MNLFDFMICIACVILFGTAMSRLNALKKEWTSKRWWIRRVGLLMTMVGSAGIIGSFFFQWSPYWFQIVRFSLYWGVALCWITTPGEPPFWKHISKNDEAKNVAKMERLERERIAAEAAAKAKKDAQAHS